MDTQEILRQLRAIDNAGDGCDALDDLMRALEAQPKIVVYAVIEGDEVQALFRDPAKATGRVEKWMIPAWVFQMEGE